MHPHLADLQQRLAVTTGQVETLARDRSEEQLTWRPSPDAWSIADCLAHLCVTVDQYRPYLPPALAQAPVVDDVEPFRPGWFGRMFIGAVGPEGRSMRAPSIFSVKHGSTDAAVVERFWQAQSEIDDWIRAADGRSLGRPRFRSPVTALVRLTPGVGLTVLVAHTERHVRQAARRPDQPGFPSS